MLTKEQIEGLKEGDLLIVEDNSSYEDSLDIGEIVEFIEIISDDTRLIKVTSSKRDDIRCYSYRFGIVKENCEDHIIVSDKFKYCKHEFRPIQGIYSILGYNCRHCDIPKEEADEYANDDLPF